MPQPQQSSSAVRQALTSLIKALTQLDISGWLTTLKDILQAIIPAKPKLEGMYEVLEYESRLELLDILNAQFAGMNSWRIWNPNASLSSEHSRRGSCRLPGRF